MIRLQDNHTPSVSNDALGEVLCVHHIGRKPMGLLPLHTHTLLFAANQLLQRLIILRLPLDVFHGDYGYPPQYTISL